MTLDTSKFTQLLEQELACLQKLTAHLQQEKAAIEQNDLPLLENLQTSKKHLLANLQQQASSRLQWLEEQQLPLSNACLDSFSDSDITTISPIWNELEKEYQQNQQLSAKLSEIVLILRHQAQKKLKILRGQFNEAPMYNQQGKHNSLGLGTQSIQV